MLRVFDLCVMIARQIAQLCVCVCVHNTLHKFASLKQLNSQSAIMQSKPILQCEVEFITPDA